MTELAQNTDWHRWLARWDAQQAGYLPHREDRFTVIASAVAALREDPLVLDLGCGPGSLSARVLARLPSARVVAVDADPVLLMLGRHALEHLGDRLVWVDADLRDEAWPNALPVNPPFDAVISTTALHWLHVPELASLYRRLAGLLRPGGAFLDGDHMPHDDDQPTISALARHVADAEPAADPIRETWSEWWAAIEDDPAFAAAFAQRARRRLEHAADEDAPAYSVHKRLLLEAGFAEVGTVWQWGSDRVLSAVR
jgi:SAM-dependent methyltransferase